MSRKTNPNKNHTIYEMVEVLNALLHGTGYVGKAPLTKKLLMGLTTDHWIQCNAFNRGGWLYDERVAPVHLREAQWKRLRPHAGISCIVFDLTVPGAAPGAMVPTLGGPSSVQPGEGE